MSAIQRRGVLLDGIGAELVRASTGGARKTLSKWLGDILAADTALDTRIDALEAGGAAFADVASAGTVDLGAQSSDKLRITGTTTITSFGTAAAGTRKKLRFAAALTLTYNATSLILPGDASITTAADDYCEAVSLGSGNWFIGNYQRGAGIPVAVTAAMTPVVQASTINAAMEILDQGAFTSTGSSAARNLATRFADYINVLDFGLVNDGVTDNTAAMATLRTYLGTLTYLPEVIWPAGVYAYATASTNWALSNLHMTFMPGAILRFTGASASNAFTCDAGAGVHITNMRIENLTVEAPSTAGHGMYFRGFSHSQLINPCVRGCGLTKAGIVIVQMVLGRIVMPRVTVNEGNWYNPGVLARPLNGIILGDAADAVNTCVCWVQFESPIIEGVSGDGIDLQASWGCTFTSGTSEGNVGWGLKGGASALVNKFRGVDFEFNTAGDITDGGVGNRYDACDSTTTAQMTSAARSCTIHMGAYKNIVFATGSQGCQVLPGTTYNRENNGGTITDNGHRNRIHVGVIDGGSHFLEDPALRTIEWSDDFLGNTLNPTYGAAVGSDGDCAISLSGSFTDGLMTLSSGNDAGGTIGANGVVWNMGTRWMRASRGGCEVSFTSAIDGITNVYMCLGLTDTTAFEAPGTLAGGDVLTTNATDGVFFVFDTNADTDTVWLCGVANDVDATKQNSTFVPVANTAYIYTISIDPSGNARFFINNVQYGTTMANAVTTSVLLTPVAFVSSANTTQRFLYTKRFTARNYRGANFL